MGFTPSQPLTQFTQSSTTDLIQSIAIYLSHSINSGDSLIRSSTIPISSPTRFQAQSKPSIDIHDYLTRLIELSPIPIDGILLGLIYFNRITTSSPTTHHPSPNPNQPSLSLVLISSLTIHRLILSCMILATKFISDRPLPRKRLGKVAGVSETELDHLERELLIRLDFKLCWSTDEADGLATDVLRSSHQPPPPPNTNNIHTIPPSTPEPTSSPVQPSFRSSISSPIIHPATTLPIQPPLRRHSTSRGIVFVKSQFIDCNLLTRKYGPHPSSNSLHDLDDPAKSPSSPTDLSSTTNPLPPTPRSSSKIIVTRLEHKQIKICHTQVF